MELTVIAVAGVANSINIVDGFNGLATFMAIFAQLGFALIKFIVGDEQLV